MASLSGISFWYTAVLELPFSFMQMKVVDWSASCSILKQNYSQDLGAQPGA